MWAYSQSQGHIQSCGTEVDTAAAIKGACITQVQGR